MLPRFFGITYTFIPVLSPPLELEPLEPEALLVADEPPLPEDELFDDPHAARPNAAIRARPPAAVTRRTVLKTAEPGSQAARGSALGKPEIPAATRPAPAPP